MLRKTANKSYSWNMNPFRVKLISQNSLTNTYSLSTFKVLDYTFFKLLKMQTCTATFEDKQFLTKLNIL